MSSTHRQFNTNEEDHKTDLESDDNYFNDVASILSKEMSVKYRQETINETHPFGIRLWKPALYKKERSIEAAAEEAVHSIPESSRESYFYPGNIAWFILFGWWMSLLYFTSGLMLKTLGHKFSKLMIQMAWYIIWPFGKYIEKQREVIIHDDFSSSPDNENEGLNQPLLRDAIDPRTSGYFHYGPSYSMRLLISRLKKRDFLIYYFFYCIVIAPMHLFASLLCWFFVISVPMAKVNGVLLNQLLRSPNSIHVKSGSSVITGEIVLCTYKAVGFRYYKYTYDGVNIILLNLMAVVIFALVDGMFIAPSIGHTGIGNPLIVFCLCIVSTIPLAYFIGMSVSSISAQSSLGMAAVINATFGSIVEIILYCLAITQGKAKLVEGAITGSFLGALLLLPGLSMITGGIKKKEQKFNSKSAVVTSTLLYMAIIGAFTPTVFYSIFNKPKYNITCDSCNNSVCLSCVYEKANSLLEDKFFLESIRPLTYICSIILVLVYLVGLWFTLRTHVTQIYERRSSVISARDSTFRFPGNLNENNHSSQNVSPEPDHQGSGHDAPAWSKIKSTIVLLVSTVLFSLLAELLVDSVDSVLKGGVLSERFIGLTLFALVPNVTEFINALAFALNNNISLSLEIGSAYTLQVALLQVPALVAFSAFYNRHEFIDLGHFFTLLFPLWDVLAVLMSIFMLTYVYNEGRTNYFKGTVLSFAYVVLVVSFAFVPKDYFK
ncbi:hypothetical protein O9G_004769 [Rozella allomycis CSF55]|uniref:Sodium/calcium exchanger membrane region domain-containing protein n=1 Tax=Rozella allomycis (strain CSF55) TaxID=988480 RepID=A0A075AWE9_ROZAC|nr:hypothetical protein O9G_004769 [Rozella allomycis CSF55]|eukprot:EPZ32884.1 hypothetical protein O9G_004769 [Rozella allomycis CSF55]